MIRDEYTYAEFERAFGKGRRYTRQMREGKTYMIVRIRRDYQRSPAETAVKLAREAGGVVFTGLSKAGSAWEDTTIWRRGTISQIELSDGFVLSGNYVVVILPTKGAVVERLTGKL